SGVNLGSQQIGGWHSLVHIDTLLLLLSPLTMQVSHQPIPAAAWRAIAPAARDASQRTQHIL
ncbi:MAG TPA: hypothetical protein DCQ70_00210, partial [Halieaceae bacterium]|nr:hypothetical protein [Halieaceae bacterium]